MKLLSLLVAALPLVLPLGGTLVDLPLEGRADAAKLDAAKARIRLETWDCAQHPHKDPGKVQLLNCSTCGQPLAKVEVDPKAERYLRVELTGQHVRVVTGPWTGIALLRQSTIDQALKDTGLTLRTTGWQLRGHVLLEVEAQAKGSREALAKALAPFGAAEIDGKTGLLLVRLAETKTGHDHAALVAAVKAANYSVKDTLWIMNQCAGELVTVK